MVALWIVLGVLVIGLAISVVTVSTRRRRRSERPGPEAPVAEVPTHPPAAAPVAAPATPPVLEAPEEPGAPPRLRDRLGKARGLFSGYLVAVRSRGALDDATWDDLEEALLRADVGVATTEALLDDLRRRVVTRELTGVDQLLVALKADLVTLLSEPGDPELAHHEVPEDLVEEAATSGPPVPAGAGARSLRFDDEANVTNVWLFVGVNGVGKTTTIGKVARQPDGGAAARCCLAAGDTFRAAAAEQLGQWAERTGTEIVRGAEGGDPSAIVFDAVQRAAARGNDLVLADTAGRLHTKVNLVEELKKIRRVADRPPGRVTEVLLVLDATTGQNGLTQARQFTEAVAVTGVVLTKLDGTAKGGVVVAIQRELGLPVKLVGLGEGADDLVAFDPEEFVDALLG